MVVKRRSNAETAVNESIFPVIWRGLPDTKKIILVNNNMNTQNAVSLYQSLITWKDNKNSPGRPNLSRGTSSWRVVLSPYHIVTTPFPDASVLMSRKSMYKFYEKIIIFPYRFMAFTAKRHTNNRNYRIINSATKRNISVYKYDFLV